MLCAAINENKAADEERPDNGADGVERTSNTHSRSQHSKSMGLT